MTIKDNMKKKMLNSRDAFEVMASVLDARDEQDKSKEFFYVLGLNVRNQINYIELVSVGTLTSSLVHPREVFKIAIMKNSACIMCCHNHPSSDVTPSKDDKLITSRLHEAGKILGIPLLDHIIIGTGAGGNCKNAQWLSMLEKGILSLPSEDNF